jgi:recombination protein RecT
MNTVAEVKKAASEKKIVTVYDFLDQKKDLIAKALPKTITIDRLIGVFSMLIKSNPELAQCSQTSLIAAVIQAVQLGLTPGNIGHFHLLPFSNNKTKTTDVQFIIGYKGSLELVNRSGKACILTTECVYQNDSFDYEQGLNPVLRHIPAEGDRGAFKAVYCIAKNLMAGEKVFIVLSKADVDKVRASSKAGSSEYSPWSKWYEEMAKKTAVKRICKMLPLSVEEQRAISQDETVKNRIDPDMPSVPDATIWDDKETIDVPATQEAPAATVNGKTQWEKEDEEKSS